MNKKESLFENSSNLVWYASYGSNLDDERFAYYIKGGYYPVTDRQYVGCDCKDAPLGDDYYELPYELYFARESGSWNGCGVAFVDPDVPGKTPARIRLITAGQLEDIIPQEGSAWYGNVVFAGKHEGYPVVTLTAFRRHPDNAPAQKYLDVINGGRRQLQALCDSKGYDITVGEIG